MLFARHPHTLLAVRRLEHFLAAVLENQAEIGRLSTLSSTGSTVLPIDSSLAVRPR